MTYSCLLMQRLVDRVSFCRGELKTFNTLVRTTLLAANGKNDRLSRMSTISNMVRRKSDSKSPEKMDLEA